MIFLYIEDTWWYIWSIFSVLLRTTDIHYCINLRYTAWWFDLHIVKWLSQKVQLTFTFHKDSIKRKKEGKHKGKTILLVIRTLRTYFLNSSYVSYDSVSYSHHLVFYIRKFVPLTTSLQFPLPHAPPLITTYLMSLSMSLVAFGLFIIF